LADLNLCVFTGRLGRDPEVKHLSSGDAAVNISIAVGKSWKDKNSGEKKEQTTWVPVSYFGKTAELVGKYCTKGSQIRVTGEFSVRKYTDKDGNEKQITEIRGSDLQLLGGRPEGSQGGGAPAPAPRPAPAPAPRAASGGFDDDIPFAPVDERLW
jgi:single-strand DNA-binding protein